MANLALESNINAKKKFIFLRFAYLMSGI